MNRRWSEQLAAKYRIRLPADLKAWFDDRLWQQQAGGEFHCPLEPEKLLDPPPGLIWTGFLQPDLLPLISNDYGDLLCLRVGEGESMSEIVAWRHGGGDWLPYGASLAEALVYDAVIGSPYSHQEHFIDRDDIDPVDRYPFAQWGLQWLSPPEGSSWPTDWADRRWPALLMQAGVAVDCLSRDQCLMHLHTPLRESRSVKASRELELPWSPEFVSWQFDSSRLPAEIRNRLAHQLAIAPAELSNQNWQAAAEEAERVAGRRSDLGWALDLLGWQAEREGNTAAAIAFYQRGLRTTQFADQAIDFRTHWFEESFGKFSAWRLYELREHLTPLERADHYLQIFHAADAVMLRQRVADYWLAAAAEASGREAHREACECYRLAGWDVGLVQLTEYEQVLAGLIDSATKAHDVARAAVAREHLAAL